jgi:tRNA nucleotidyltransferase (CCA-adding enzyme)
VLDDLAATLPALSEMPRSSGRAPRRTAALLVALGGRGSGAAVERWVERLRIGREASAVVREAAAKSAAALRALDRAGAVRDSRIYSVLAPLSPETLVYLRGIGGPRVRERVDRFAETLSYVRLEVSGDDLLALGAQPGSAFSDILARVRARRLDGAVEGRESELAELRRLAVRSGIIPQS